VRQNRDGDVPAIARGKRGNFLQCEPLHTDPNGHGLNFRSRAVDPIFGFKEHRQGGDMHTNDNIPSGNNAERCAAIERRPTGERGRCVRPAEHDDLCVHHWRTEALYGPVTRIRREHQQPAGRQALGAELPPFPDSNEGGAYCRASRASRKVEKLGIAPGDPGLPNFKETRRSDQNRTQIDRTNLSPITVAGNDTRPEIRDEVFDRPGCHRSHLEVGAD
jgi:hypothetical protein